jgi:D-arginine dehydrogenase
MTIIQEVDFLIIGSGIAGASAGYELSKIGRCVILEKEDAIGYHTTGRSAAIYTTTYMAGDPVIRSLVLPSGEFLHHPPEGFSDYPLLTPRGMLYLAEESKMDQLLKFYEKLRKDCDDLELLGSAEIKKILPIVTDKYAHKAIYEKTVFDMDVHAIHEGFLKGIRKRGSQIITDAGATKITFSDGFWTVETPKGTFKSKIIINAAGAWADQIAALAGITPIDIQPQRRTVILISPPEGLEIENYPFCYEIDEEFYFKPDAGKILVSPADETPSAPCDAQPEEIDIAYAAHYLEKATGIEALKVDHSWAGLRSHVKDHYPVAGFAKDAKGFFWLAGQGGFGIKTAPALARITAALVQGHDIPEDIKSHGIRQEMIAPDRLT